MNSGVRYRRRPLFSVAAPNSRRVVLFPDGERRMISPAMQAALDKMAAFRTLEEHAVGSSRRLVGDALRGGLLLSEAEFLERASRACDAAGPRIATIASPSLARALRSYEANARAFGHAPRLVTAGSEDERRSVAVALAADKVDGRAARFALSEGPGAARNALLLQTVGEAFVMADEDTVCELCRPAGHVKSLAIPRSLQTAPIAGPAAAINLIGEFSAALRGAIDRGTAISGDCDDDAIAAFLAGRARVDVACAGVGVSPATLTLLRTGSLTQGCIALDNRRFLPPFPPLGANAGKLFGVWMRAANSRSFTAHMPFAVPATDSAAPAPESPCNEVVRLFSEDLAPSVPSNLTPPERLMWLGARLREIGLLPAADFRQKWLALRLEELAREVAAERVRMTASRLRTLERQMCGTAAVDAESGPASAEYTESCGRLLETWPAMTAAAVRLRHAGRVWSQRGPAQAALRS